MVAVMHAPYALRRDEGERLKFGEAVILLRATAESSGGALTIWEELPPERSSICPASSRTLTAGWCRAAGGSS